MSHYRYNLTHEEMVQELRLAFQKRVGDFALTPFTITPEESSEWIKKFPVGCIPTGDLIDE